MPFCMGCYAPNQIRSNGIGREYQRQFISSVRSHPDRTPLSRIRGRSELNPRIEGQECGIRPHCCSSLHVHIAQIEFDEHMYRMAKESCDQAATRILAERRDPTEDPQQGNRYMRREPRRHHSATIEGINERFEIDY